MAYGLTVLRKSKSLPDGLRDLEQNNRNFQLKRAEGEAKRIGNDAEYIRLVNLNRLDGWYQNDMVRDAEINDFLVANTLGFGIADGGGKLIAEFKTLPQAESAIAGAKVEMKVDISLPKERPDADTIDVPAPRSSTQSRLSAVSEQEPVAV